MPEAAAFGYGHPAYARALSDLGRPVQLQRCGGWLLERPIPGRPERDAIGPYPLFVCQDWPQLGRDLDELAGSLVSAGLVVDPLQPASLPLLEQQFDVIAPFKTHYLVDLHLPAAQRVTRHHRRNVRLAERNVAVEHSSDPAASAAEWQLLYADLIRKHAISGLAAFSDASLAAQLSVPGAIVFRARHAGETVGMTVWYAGGDLGYYHLSAFSALGYKLRASYAIMWYALEHLAGRVRWVNLGGSAGLKDDGGTSGLARFKAGWATETRPTYFCGRILDRPRYEALAASAGAASDYFPAYRGGSQP